MQRSDPQSPAPSPGRTGHGSVAPAEDIASSSPNTPTALSNSLQELLRATDRTLPSAGAGFGAPAGGSGATDLELLLLLQRQRQRLSGVSSLFLQQQQQQQQQRPHHSEGDALNDLRNDTLLYGLRSGMGSNNDSALLRQAEALLAMQQQHRGNMVDASSVASLSAMSNASSSNLASSFLPTANREEQHLPADISAVLQARLRRSHEQQQLAAQQAQEKSQKLKKSSSLGKTSDHTDVPEDDSANEDGSKSGESAGVDADSKGDGESAQGGEAGATNKDEDADFPVNDTFPYKLYRMLENSEKQGNDGIVSFCNEGRAFIIHKADDFVAKIMPHYFTTSRMTSFQRQLNLYGFRRISEGPDKGAYYHKYFMKGRRKLCKKIKRKKNHPKPPPVFMAPSDGGQGLHGLMMHGGLGGQASGALSSLIGGGASGFSSTGLGLPSLPPSMADILRQQQQQQLHGLSGGGLSPALQELRQRQQAQSDLFELLRHQQRQDQLQRLQQQQDGSGKNIYHGFFPPNL